MSSIVIPAHNEAAGIERCLKALLPQLKSTDEVVVVCNGCSDTTATIAKKYTPIVRVIEIAEASKTSALNVGDSAVVSYPRVYLDADVRLEKGALEALLNGFSNQQLLALSPSVYMNLDDSSFLVCSYYRAWMATPYFQEGMMGSGAYVLSEAGRQRFTEFPSVISDDGFVRAQFSERERFCVQDAKVSVFGPHTLSDLLKIKTRSRLGLYQLRAAYPELMQSEGKRYLDFATTMTKNPRHWIDLAVYIAVNLASRFRARVAYRTIDRYTWNVDSSSRGGTSKSSR